MLKKAGFVPMNLNIFETLRVLLVQLSWQLRDL
jgi:hypothetical protein